MNEFQILRERILKECPVAKARWRPDKPDVYWFLDITLGEKYIAIEWNPGKGFNIADLTNPDNPLFLPDLYEVYGDVESTLQEIVRLLTLG